MESLGNVQSSDCALNGKKFWRPETIAQHAGVAVADVEKATQQYFAVAKAWIWSATVVGEPSEVCG